MKSPDLLSPSAEPKYLWFADQLRRSIEAGELKPGDRLPSQAKIREQHQITQPTIERAHAILEREGLIVRRERQGIFVAEPPAPANNGTAPPAGRTPALGFGTIGVLAVNDGRPKQGHREMGWSDFITQGALEGCRAAGRHALLLSPDLLEHHGVDELLAHPPLGFIVTSLASDFRFEQLQTMVKSLAEGNRPIVIFGEEPEFAGFDRVAPDHEQGCYELTRLLINRGCRRILPFWPSMRPGHFWIHARRSGYERAMREAGLEPLPVREIPLRRLPGIGDATAEMLEQTSRYKAGYLADYLGRHLRCDAIMDVTDGEIPSTAAACRLLGYEPGKDVLLTGYDNYWSEVPERRFEPTWPVASVDKQNWLLGEALTQLLQARLNGELPSEPQMRRVPTRLVPLEADGP